MSRRISEKSGKKADGAAAGSGVPADSGYPFPANTGNSVFPDGDIGADGVHVLRPGKRCFRRNDPKMVRDAGLEPANLSVLGPKPSAFANFASRARRSRL